MIFMSRPLAILSLLLAGALPSHTEENAGLRLNDLEYLEMPGLNVMLAHDFYPEGHQGGVSIIQNGLRVGTNGDLRLDRTPGQWSPVPKVGERVIDREAQEISIRMEYPDPEKDRKGFNPVVYPDLEFAYTIRVRPEGRAFRILVDLEEPLPEEWIGRVGFNFELFPGILFGRTWATESGTGPFPRQANGPGRIDAAFARTDDGRVWMGVDRGDRPSGLAFFDGVAWHPAGTTASLVAPRVLGLDAADDDTLWVTDSTC